MDFLGLVVVVVVVWVRVDGALHLPGRRQQPLFRESSSVLFLFSVNFPLYQSSPLVGSTWEPERKQRKNASPPRPAQSTAAGPSTVRFGVLDRREKRDNWKIDPLFLCLSVNGDNKHTCLLRSVGNGKSTWPEWCVGRVFWWQYTNIEMVVNITIPKIDHCYKLITF